MKQRQWIVRRSSIQTSDAKLRWDRTYQSLIQWGAASRGERAQSPLVQEGSNESRHVMCGCPPTVRLSRKRSSSRSSSCMSIARFRGGEGSEEHLFRDDGYSGASLRRPWLDRLRDQVRCAAFDRVIITTPDRLARNYVHQMLLVEEFERGGCQVEFLDRPH
jgi:Resolvase, N terminal domain